MSTIASDPELLESPRFSMRQARSLVPGLNTPNPRIYWTDFLITVVSGHALFAALLYNQHWLTGPAYVTWPIKVALYIGIVLLFMRAAMFTHELVHLPKDGFKGFRIAWNLLCGIPFLVPSFMYYPHVDHHRRKSYGTDDDGEYLNLSHQPPRAIVLYMLMTFFTPIAALFRFAVLAPLGWIFPSIRRWNFRRASTMVMDISYKRPEAGARVIRIMNIQEVLCFCFCMWFIFRTPVRYGEWYDPLWLQAYLVSVGLLIVNNIRTLGAHRWTGDGSQLTFEQQLLDSCDYPYRPWFTELWGPIGTRFHATHHLFPGIPYHNLGTAHRALMNGLPQVSVLRETVKTSLIGEVAKLWIRSSEAFARRDKGDSSNRAEYSKESAT